MYADGGTGWCARGGYGEGVHGWGMAGWVPGGAIPGYYPAARKEVPGTAERAPEGLQGLEWVVPGTGCVRAPGPPLRGPVGPPVALPVLDLSSGKCRLLANKGENSGIFQ